MVASRVNLQLGKHLSAHFAFWKHASDSVTHDLLRLSFQACLGSFTSKTCVAGVPGVSFLIQLVARELDLVTVGNDYKIASVYVRRVSRLVLAH